MKMGKTHPRQGFYAAGGLLLFATACLFALVRVSMVEPSFDLEDSSIRFTLVLAIASFATTIAIFVSAATVPKRAQVRAPMLIALLPTLVAGLTLLLVAQFGAEPFDNISNPNTADPAWGVSVPVVLLPVLAVALSTIWIRRQVLAGDESREAL